MLEIIRLGDSVLVHPGSRTPHGVRSVSRLTTGVLAAASQAMPERPRTLDELEAHAWLGTRSESDGPLALRKASKELREAGYTPEDWLTPGTVPVPRVAIIESRITLSALGFLIRFCEGAITPAVLAAILGDGPAPGGDGVAEDALINLRQRERDEDAPLRTAATELVDAGYARWMMPTR